jgi:hypothetical protein
MNLDLAVDVLSQQAYRGRTFRLERACRLCVRQSKPRCYENGSQARVVAVPCAAPSRLG